MKKYVFCLIMLVTFCVSAQPVVIRYPGLIESAVGLVSDVVGLATGRTVVYNSYPDIVYQPPVYTAPAPVVVAPPVYRSVVPCPAPVYAPAPVVVYPTYDSGYYVNNYYYRGTYYSRPVYRAPVYYRPPVYYHSGPHYYHHHHHHRH